MKVFNSLFAVLLLLIICTSCTDIVDSKIVANEAFIQIEDVVVVSSPKKTKSDAINNLILKFKNEAIFKSITNRLDNARTSERIAFADSLGFVSLAKLMKEADVELEKLSESTTDETVFRAAYKLYKQKYSMFLFNDADTSDLSPYFSLKNDLVANYVNTSGEFMIGDELVQCSQLNTYEEKSNLRTMSVYADLPVNDVVGEVSKRKVGLHMNLDNYRVITNFTSQKKGIFGWVRYSTVYYAKFFLSNFSRVIYVPMTGGVPGHNIAIDKNNQWFDYASAEEDGNYTFTLGDVSGASNWKTTGYADVWSRGVPKDNAGKMRVNLPR